MLTVQAILFEFNDKPTSRRPTAVPSAKTSGSADQVLMSASTTRHTKISCSLSRSRPQLSVTQLYPAPRHSSESHLNVLASNVIGIIKYLPQNLARIVIKTYLLHLLKDPKHHYLNFHKSDHSRPSVFTEQDANSENKSRVREFKITITRHTITGESGILTRIIIIDKEVCLTSQVMKKSCQNIGNRYTVNTSTTKNEMPSPYQNHKISSEVMMSTHRGWQFLAIHQKIGINVLGREHFTLHGLCLTAAEMSTVVEVMVRELTSLLHCHIGVIIDPVPAPSTQQRPVHSMLHHRNNSDLGSEHFTLHGLRQTAAEMSTVVEVMVRELTSLLHCHIGVIIDPVPAPSTQQRPAHSLLHHRNNSDLGSEHFTLHGLRQTAAEMSTVVEVMVRELTSLRHCHIGVIIDPVPAPSTQQRPVHSLLHHRNNSDLGSEHFTLHGRRQTAAEMSTVVEVMVRELTSLLHCHIGLRIDRQRPAHSMLHHRNNSDLDLPVAI
ncbi:hypothetical protein J6590_086515 [Homalodisca vitripennis]|nr:hypothetical protein J6590_086515 [Homalodisca vitripennis]